ncbi:peroxidasin homolog isoform 1-T3 [Pholidichthys leucotaenia]
MEAVVGLLVVFLTVSCGMDTCDGRQNGAQCYGALGGTVVIQLMDNALETERYMWTKNKTQILRVRNNMVVFNLIEDRAVFIPSDGTLRINNLSRSDGGEYVLEAYKHGKRFLIQSLQLSIQAPVSSVWLTSKCLSEGEMRVSCSSQGGDSPQYSWTLDGRALTDDELLYGNNEAEIITLKQNVVGRLRCSVRNTVSDVTNSTMISSCGFTNINCTSVSGTHTPQWVHQDNIILCTGTTPPPVTRNTVGMDTCDGRQNGAQCYGALGGTVVIQLMDNALEIERYTWRKNKTQILRVRNNMVVFNLIEDRAVFIPSDGTLRINNLSRSDGGEYVLEAYKHGKRFLIQSLQLSIQAPVSSVWLTSKCLSEGEMRVSCSSQGGDSPQYSWTLDGRALTDELLYGNNEAEIITLKQNVVGRLRCSVRNTVSDVTNSMTISSCGFTYINCTSFDGTYTPQWVHQDNIILCTGTTPPPVTQNTVGQSLLICGLRTVAVILILIGISIYFVWKKKKNEKNEASNVPQMNPENSVLMVEIGSSTTYANS